MSETRVRVSLTDGVFEFEGPEHFVTGLVEKFAPVIQTALAGEPSDAGSGNSSDGAGAARPAAASAPPAPEVALGDIFAATESGVQILRAFPGPTKSERAATLAKLYLYGLQTLKKRDTAYFAEIGRVCKAHGCYDSKNLATHLKGDQTSFVFGGRGKRQTIKLSVPGLEGTAALIARILAEGKGIASRPKGTTRDAFGSAPQQKESMPMTQATVAASRQP